MPKPQQVVGTAIGLMVMLLIGTVLLGLIFGLAPNFIATGATGTFTDSLGVTGGSGTIQPGGASTVDDVTRVRASLNDSVALTGAPDSNVSIESTADLGHDFSVCTWGALENTVVTNNGNGTLLATQSAVLWYNGSSDTWEGYYYNTSSRNSFRASVAAPSPASPTLVCLNHQSQSLNVSANTTTGSAVATGSTNVADYPDNVTNWNGTVEETRLYGTALNGSQRTEWVNEPSLAVNGSAPAARVTYDTFGGSVPSSFEVYFASGSATASNATLATGQPAPAISEGADYSTSDDTISILSGGALEADGEVLYINGDASASGWYATLLDVSDQAQSTISFATLLPFLVVALLVIAMIRL